MDCKNIINNISEIIYYSKLSHKLRLNQIIQFNLICKKHKLLNMLPYDIIIIISNMIVRNKWYETKKIINLK